MPDEIPHDTQVTPAHVYELVKDQVVPRLVALEGKVDELEKTTREAGLNGHTPLLKAFLEQYAATYLSRQAWQTVRSDLRHRLSWLAPGKHWLTVFLSAVIGALAWAVANHLLLIWPTTNPGSP